MLEKLYQVVSGVVPPVEPVVVHGSLTYNVTHIPLNSSLCHPPKAPHIHLSLVIKTTQNITTASIN